MSIFAVKIHYDRRDYIPQQLKYCQPPISDEEYLEYLSQGEEGKGGKGFHECMNFKVDENGQIQLYLPPNYFPSKEKNIGLHTIIWITYGSDPVLPWHIIGIHHNVKLCKNHFEYSERKDTSYRFNNEPLVFHGESSCFESTLFTAPLELDKERHIPSYKNWGNGRRYLQNEHVKLILNDRIRCIGTPKNTFEKEELIVLKRVLNEFDATVNKRKLATKPTIPDKELGEWGEFQVYKNELKYANANSISEKEVEWISQKYPQCEYDIRSFRKKGKEISEIFIEVKTTKDIDKPSILISQRQIEFATERASNHTFAFVDALSESIEYLSLKEIEQRYELLPEKFRLQKK